MSIEAEIEFGGNAVDADFRFHVAIFRSVHNRYFPQLLEFLGNFIIPPQTLNLASGSEEQVRYLRKIQAEHVEIYEAIRAQNTASALKAARQHLSNALSRYDAFTYRRPTASSGRWASQPCGIGTA
jgi:GntR family transcriptional regulator, transcriptional repressor for pyruvate dehydrogenase complex